MFQQRKERNRREFRDGGFREQAQKRSGRGVAERTSGRIVDCNAPASHLGRDAAGEIAIGRDERGATSVRLQCFAQYERDGSGLLSGMRRLD